MYVKGVSSPLGQVQREAKLKIHRNKSRCRGCKHALSHNGSKTRCNIIRDKDDQPAEVVTLATDFERYENCAYRMWANGMFSGPPLVDLARQVRAGFIEAFDFPGETSVI